MLAGYRKKGNIKLPVIYGVVVIWQLETRDIGGGLKGKVYSEYNHVPLRFIK